MCTSSDGSTWSRQTTPAVSQALQAGAAASGNLYYTSTVPSVSIGGAQAQVYFSGLALGFVGLYQINVQVPANLTPSNNVNITVTIGGVTSNVATIAVAT